MTIAHAFLSGFRCITAAIPPQSRRNCGRSAAEVQGKQMRDIFEGKLIQAIAWKDLTKPKQFFLILL
ncbi:MAG TPA: hypothetical protein PLX59_07115 [Candidatus Cloacimonadota bacterium]|nr:hypothetical protein [Candidatus Cloacimonadota bacterium]